MHHNPHHVFSLVGAALHTVACMVLVLGLS